MMVTREKPPLSKEVLESVTFPVYYPQPVPAGYSLKKDSVKYTNEILFYTLKNAQGEITVSQQIKPQSVPDIAHFKDFSPISSPLGTAVVGKNKSIATAILLTDQTMLTAITNGAASSDDISAIVLSLQKL
jgi:hypothetical protein